MEIYIYILSRISFSTLWSSPLKDYIKCEAQGLKLLYIFFGENAEKRAKRAMAQIRVTMEVGNDGVAVITMSNPPVNALAIPSKALLSQTVSPSFDVFLGLHFWRGDVIFLSFSLLLFSNFGIEGEIRWGNEEKWCQSYCFNR